MTSIDNHYRQRQPSYFMPVSSLKGLIYAYDGAGTFDSASWANLGSPYLSSVNGAGAGILKDLGKQVVSSGRTFRKIQLVVRNGALTGNQSTFGVAGAANTVPNQDFLTGYIELGYEGTGPATPVVSYGTY
jgi:hypothetical protein